MNDYLLSYYYGISYSYELLNALCRVEVTRGTGI